jgi:hypothetical protein
METIDAATTIVMCISALEGYEFISHHSSIDSLVDTMLLRTKSAAF